MRIVLLDGPWSTYILQSHKGETILAQFEHDIVRVAQTFGWPGTDDGSAEARSEAFTFLASRVGESVEDSGYF